MWRRATSCGQSLHDRIAESRAELKQALTELREVSHGIYPALARSGLGRAFDVLAGHSQNKLTVTEAAVGRFSPVDEARRKPDT